MPVSYCNILKWLLLFFFLRQASLEQPRPAWTLWQWVLWNLTAPRLRTPVWDKVWKGLPSRTIHSGGNSFAVCAAAMLRIVLGYSGLHPSVYTGENQSNYGTFKNAEDLHWEAQSYTLPQSTWVDHCGFCHTHQVSERPLLILVTEILLKTIVQSDL